jgi:hypothetical protein
MLRWSSVSQYGEQTQFAELAEHAVLAVDLAAQPFG